MSPGLGIGTDVAHLLAGCVLLLSFAALYQRQLPATVAVAALQAIALALAAAWQSWLQGSLRLSVVALLVLAVNGGAVTLALRGMIRRQEVEPGIAPTLAPFPVMAIGVALVAVAVLAVLPMTAGTAAGAGRDALGGESLALALSVMLLGLLTTLTRRAPLAQAMGVVSLVNGVLLAALGMPALPLVVPVAAMLVLLSGCILFACMISATGPAAR